jgi:hypothetical protein
MVFVPASNPKQDSAVGAAYATADVKRYADANTENTKKTARVFICFFLFVNSLLLSHMVAQRKH